MCLSCECCVLCRQQSLRLEVELQKERKTEIKKRVDEKFALYLKARSPT